MSYLFNTDEQQAEMLKTIGVDSIEALFNQIPEEYHLKRALNLGEPMSELELQSHLTQLAGQNGGVSSRVCFQGGGAYDHFIPAAVDEIASRGEFYTAYTPYQAEASQGSLQAFFEYQTLICQLTGMDVSNASLYEGGTAVSEAAFMAMRETRRHSKIVVLGSVHPEYTQVCKTYFTHLECEVITVPTPEGTADPDRVASVLDDQTACLVIQQPNFFGCLEETAVLTELAHNVGALAVVSVDPLSLGVLKKPADYGADIVVAEGQSLGVPLQYGGPYLGILACRDQFKRKLPGRLIGTTVDRHGNPCYVLNLQAREQHIRREKATSNICTNQGLLALRATVHLSLLGPQGLKEAATLSCQKAHYAANELTKIDSIELTFDRPFFKEFALKFSKPVTEVMQAAADAGFDLGPEFSRFASPLKYGSPAMLQSCLVAVTEKRTKTEIDHLADVLRNH